MAYDGRKTSQRRKPFCSREELRPTYLNTQAIPAEIGACSGLAELYINNNQKVIMNRTVKRAYLPESGSFVAWGETICLPEDLGKTHKYQKLGCLW